MCFSVFEIIFMFVATCVLLDIFINGIVSLLVHHLHLDSDLRSSDLMSLLIFLVSTCDLYVMLMQSRLCKVAVMIVKRPSPS